LVAIYAYLAFKIPTSSSECVAIGHCDGVFYRGVGELLAVGNSEVYDPEMIQRWWQSSERSTPLVEQSLQGSPASLPFYLLYGLGTAPVTIALMGLFSMLLLAGAALWVAGPVFALACMVGAWTPAAILFGAPSLFYGAAAILLLIGLREKKPWLSGLALAFLAFRAEIAIWIFIGLMIQKSWRVIGIASFYSAVLWTASTLYWGHSLCTQWMESLWRPGDSVDPGIGLLGLLPGVDSSWIGVWWFVYGIAGSFALWSWFRFSAEKALAISLGIALLFAPQTDPSDVVLLAPVALVFYARPVEVLWAAGGLAYVLIGLEVEYLLSIVTFWVMYKALRVVSNDTPSES